MHSPTRNANGVFDASVRSDSTRSSQMFHSQMEVELPLEDSQWLLLDQAKKGVLDDTDRLDGLLEAMSRTVATVASMGNEELDFGQTPFGEMLYDQINMWPTRGQLNELDDCRESMAFCEHTRKTALRMKQLSHQFANVQIKPFLGMECFKPAGWAFVHNSEDRTKRYLVGGLRGALFKVIRTKVASWLKACDSAMMHVFKDLVADEPPGACKIEALINDTSVHIACKLTYMGDNHADDALSSNAFEARTAKQIEEAKHYTHDSMHCEMVALTCLKLLSMPSVDYYVVKDQIEERFNTIKYMVERRYRIFPDEVVETLGLHFLERCVTDDYVDTDVRIALHGEWYKIYGAAAYEASLKGIEEFNIMRPRGSYFVKVLQISSETPRTGVDAQARNASNHMPAMPFFEDAKVWQFVKGDPCRRSGLNWSARRAVRLYSMVQQLNAHGALPQGMMKSNIVTVLATQAVVESNLVLHLLDDKRKLYANGTTLLKACEDITDRESFLQHKVRDAILHVSRFSTVEIMAIFHHFSNARSVIYNEFVVRTRKHLTTSKIPRKYPQVVFDVMSLLLPIIYRQRASAGHSLTTTVDPIFALLRELPQVQQWTPCQGALRLTKEDLKDGPAILQFVLASLRNRGLLVEWKRPNAGKQRLMARHVYEFDTLQLLELANGGSLKRFATA